MPVLTVNKVDAGTFAAPVTRMERVLSLDVLRGFALLGILVLNIQDFASPAGILHDIPLEVVSQTGRHHALDVVIMTIQWLFFEGKMRALFAALFGAGTVLLLERIEHRSGAGVAADVFHRRNMWLVLFGILHGALIWYGDILLYYGLMALVVLYPLRSVAGKKLVAAGFAISLIGGTFGIANFLDLRSAWPEAKLQEGAYNARIHHQVPTPAQSKAVTDAVAKRRAELDAIPKAAADGRRSYRETEPSNARFEAGFATAIFTSGWVFEIAGMLIAGMGLYKVGFLSARLSSRTYLAIAVIGYTIALPITLVGLHHSSLFGFSDAVTTVWMYIPYVLEQAACMLANASIVLLLIRSGALMPLQRALSAVGRTAFSNYILTSLFCQFLFRWGPWKLYGSLEYYQQIYVVLGVWTLNVLFSTLWLRFFSSGPLEWGWRSLTYWKRQPLLAHN